MRTDHSEYMIISGMQGPTEGIRIALYYPLLQSNMAKVLRCQKNAYISMTAFICQGGGISSQATAEIDAKPAAHILCSDEQLPAYALLPSLWHNSQVADVGHVLGALVCHEGPLLNPFCWQVGALHVDHNSAKQTYSVWRYLEASLHNIISLLGSQLVGV